MKICRSLFFVTKLILLCGFVASAQKPTLFVQTGHAGGVKCIAFSGDGKMLASGGSDKTIRFWDFKNGRELRRLSAHEFGVDFISFSPDGRVLASGGNDGLLKIWDVATGQMLRSFKRFSADAFVFSGDGQSVITASKSSSSVSIWDITTGQNRTLFYGHGEAATVAFSPDGKFVAFTIRDKTIRPLIQITPTVTTTPIEVWEVATGRQTATLTSSGYPSMAFSRDNKLLATAASKDVDVWDLTTGQKTKELHRNYAYADSVAFSPDGRTLACGGFKEISAWDVASGRALYTMAAHSSLVSSIVFTTDGRRFATAAFEDRTIRLWETPTGRQLRLLGGHDYVTSLAFNTDGMMLVKPVDSETISVWDVAFGKNLRTFPWNPAGASSVAFSPDGKFMAGTTPDDPINLWDVASGRKLRTLAGHVHGVRLVQFSPDGKTLASSGTYDKTVKLWEVTSGQELRSLKYGDYLWSLTFSRDGKTLILGGSPKTVEIFDVTSGQKLRAVKFPQSRGGFGSGPLDDFSRYAFSANGLIAAGAETYDGTVKLLDMTSGRELKTLGVLYETEGHWNSIEALAFSSDDKTLVTASYDGTIKLWDVATARELQTLKGHNNPVTAIAFSADGKLLASASTDAIIKLWDLATAKEVVSLIAADEQDWLAVTPDGLFDGSAAAWNQILWRFTSSPFDVAPVEIFFNEFYYPGLLQEVIAGKRPRATQDIATRDRRQPQLDIILAAADASSAGINDHNVSIKIAVTEAPAGAQDLRLFRNGSLVKVWRGDVLNGQSSSTLEATVALVAGENRLTAYAFNRDNIKSPDAQLTVTGADSLKRAATAYILAIGVNVYANLRYNLRYAVADSQAFAEEMRRQQSKLGQYADVKVISLADKDATKLKILDALKALRSQVQPEDALLIYFAGHGTAQHNRFYLIPHDLGYAGPRTALNKAGLQSILSHSISDLELQQAVEGIDAGRLLLVIDACNSGQALEAEEKRRGPMNSKGLAQLAYEKGMYILTAAQSYQAAQEASRLGHGFLTYALVEEGLKSDAADKDPKDGQVFLREWLDFATARVPEMQLEKVEEQKKQGRQLEQLIVFAEGDKSKDRQVQRPRVFYRREAETSPLVVARRKL